MVLGAEQMSRALVLGGGGPVGPRSQPVDGAQRAFRHCGQQCAGGPGGDDQPAAVVVAAVQGHQDDAQAEQVLDRLLHRQRRSDPLLHAPIMAKCRQEPALYAGSCRHFAAVRGQLTAGSGG